MKKLYSLQTHTHSLWSCVALGDVPSDVYPKSDHARQLIVIRSSPQNAIIILSDNSLPAGFMGRPIFPVWSQETLLVWCIYSFLFFFLNDIKGFVSFLHFIISYCLFTQNQVFPKILGGSTVCMYICAHAHMGWCMWEKDKIGPHVLTHAKNTWRLQAIQK